MWDFFALDATFACAHLLNKRSALTGRRAVPVQAKGNTMQTEFTPWLSLAGGVLIGSAAVLLMWLNGRIAGMTGILAGFLPPFESDWLWRVAFTVGAIVSPLIYIAAGNDIAFDIPVSTTALIISGLVVGVGVTYGGGCTSGHGICGMARLSPRSIVATVVFMITTFATVYLVRHVWGQA